MAKENPCFRKSRNQGFCAKFNCTFLFLLSFRPFIFGFGAWLEPEIIPLNSLTSWGVADYKIIQTGKALELGTFFVAAENVRLYIPCIFADDIHQLLLGPDRRKLSPSIIFHLSAPPFKRGLILKNKPPWPIFG